jgi:hypothetical protein
MRTRLESNESGEAAASMNFLNPVINFEIFEEYNLLITSYNLVPSRLDPHRNFYI